MMPTPQDRFNWLFQQDPNALSHDERVERQQLGAMLARGQTPPEGGAPVQAQQKVQAPPQQPQQPQGDSGYGLNIALAQEGYDARNEELRRYITEQQQLASSLHNEGADKMAANRQLETLNTILQNRLQSPFGGSPTIAPGPRFTPSGTAGTEMDLQPQMGGFSTEPPPGSVQVGNIGTIDPRTGLLHGKTKAGFANTMGDVRESGPELQNLLFQGLKLNQAGTPLDPNITPPTDFGHRYAPRGGYPNKSLGMADIRNWYNTVPWDRISTDTPDPDATDTDAIIIPALMSMLFGGGLASAYGGGIGGGAASGATVGGLTGVTGGPTGVLTGAATGGLTGGLSGGLSEGMAYPPSGVAYPPPDLPDYADLGQIGVGAPPSAAGSNVPMFEGRAGQTFDQLYPKAPFLHPELGPTGADAVLADEALDPLGNDVRHLLDTPDVIPGGEGGGFDLLKGLTAKDVLGAGALLGGAGALFAGAGGANAPTPVPPTLESFPGPPSAPSGGGGGEGGPDVGGAGEAAQSFIAQALPGFGQRAQLFDSLVQRVLQELEGSLPIPDEATLNARTAEIEKANNLLVDQEAEDSRNAILEAANRMGINPAGRLAQVDRAVLLAKTQNHSSARAQALALIQVQQSALMGRVNPAIQILQLLDPTRALSAQAGVFGNVLDAETRFGLGELQNQQHQSDLGYQAQLQNINLQNQLALDQYHQQVAAANAAAATKSKGYADLGGALLGLGSRWLF